jgi:hypothetical protein
VCVGQTSPSVEIRFKEHAGYPFGFEHTGLNYAIHDLPRERGHSSWLYPVNFNKDSWDILSWSWNSYWHTSRYDLRTTRVACEHPTFCRLSNIDLVLSMRNEHLTTHYAFVLVHLETNTLGSDNCVYCIYSEQHQCFLHQSLKPGIETDLSKLEMHIVLVWLLPRDT